MKRIYLLIVFSFVLGSNALAQTETPRTDKTGIAPPEAELMRIKIEWLNAEECGIEGCKPQSVVLRSGSSMSFMWPNLPERGAFEIRPLILKETVEVKVKRTKEPKDGGAAAVTTETFLLQQGEPQEVKIDELRWMLTASKWVRPEKK